AGLAGETIRSGRGVRAAGGERCSRKADTMSSDADKENTLLLELDTGPVTIQLLPEKAPGHVARIKELARQGFYDGVVFHRVINAFMAQGGDPTGTGTGGSGKKLKA